MWIVKMRLKHKCILGDRCRKFRVTLQSLDVARGREGGRLFVSSIHQIAGAERNIKAFVRDLAKDPKVVYLESHANTIFLIDKTEQAPVSSLSRLLFFIKPVVVDPTGTEHWELASHKKEVLMDWISKVKPHMERFELLSMKDTKLQNVYFPKLMPKLTPLQKRALELAVAEGYYAVPKRTTVRELARKMRVSFPTFHRHLQKAESKLMPDLLSFLK